MVLCLYAFEKYLQSDLFFRKSDKHDFHVNLKEKLKMFEKSTDDQSKPNMRGGDKPKKKRPVSKAFEEFENSGIIIGMVGGKMTIPVTFFKLVQHYHNTCRYTMLKFNYYVLAVFFNLTHLEWGFALTFGFQCSI